MRGLTFSLFVLVATSNAVLNCLMASASVMWTVDANGKLNRNGSPVVLRGFSTTCMEYLLRGIGTPCLTTYNFNDPANIITAINRQELDALYSFMLPAPNGVVPGIRLTLNAGYYLDVSTTNWASNRAKFPNLSNQYKALVNTIVQDATSRGIVVILDLHWNDDVTEQQEMALKGSGNTNTGDSLTFWGTLSATFANNPLVWYELYNEPHAASVDVWLNGNTKFEGMKAMAATVRANNVKGMILVGGAFDFAYDADSLIQFSQNAPLDQVAFVFHPYMGPLQQSDTAKSAVGFATRLEQVLVQTKRPVVVTEMGQFCCASEGACFQYPGTFNGKSMGYVRALLTEMQATQTSWTAWAYRPGTGGDCNQPDMNDGRNLYASANHNNQGANWINLFPTFYGASIATSPTAPIVPIPTQVPVIPPTTIVTAPVAPPSKTSTVSTTNVPAIQPSSAPGDANANATGSWNAGGPVAGGLIGLVLVASAMALVHRRQKSMLSKQQMISRNPLFEKQ